VLLTHAVVSGMSSPLANKALPETLLVSFVLIISLIISLIHLWTCADFDTSAASATFLCTDQSFWNEPIHSLDCSCVFDEFGDDLIGRGGHCGIFVHHELQEDFPLVVPWDSTKEVEDVLLHIHLGDCLCFRIGVGVSNIRASSQCCYWSGEEIPILDFPIDWQGIVADISVVR
jgi:hypothetical protein